MFYAVLFSAVSGAVAVGWARRGSDESESQAIAASSESASASRVSPRPFQPFRVEVPAQVQKFENSRAVWIAPKVDEVEKANSLDSLGEAKKKVSMALLEVPYGELERGIYESGLNEVPGVTEWLDEFASLRTAIMARDGVAVAVEADKVMALVRKLDDESGGDDRYHEIVSGVKNDPEGRKRLNFLKDQMILVANTVQLLSAGTEGLEKK
jgi:hypothetical protein